MRDHQSLKVFELAHQLVLEVYRASHVSPRDERYGLTAQLRRGAVSVAANVVEGCSRRSNKEFVRFLEIAFGSVREVGYYLMLGRDLGYLTRSLAAALSAFIRARHRSEQESGKA